MTAPAVSPPTAPFNPASWFPKTLVRLAGAWEKSAGFETFEPLWSEFFGQYRGVLADATGDTQACLVALPKYYLDEIRPATPYLFKEWMPLGYNAMVALPKGKAHRAAARALLHYGMAVTLLDDVADTDEFEERFGDGGSEKIARCVQHQIFGRPHAAPPLPAEAMHLVTLVASELRSFLDATHHLVRAIRDRALIVARLRDFLESVVICRRVRRKLAAGSAVDADLCDLATAAPQGMTVVMVALMSALLHPARDQLSLRRAQRDAACAERICHYQNAIATLERERESGDPSNPIVIESIRRGTLEPCAYLSKQMDPRDFEYATDMARHALSRKLDILHHQFESNASDYSKLGAADFFYRLRFGVRNLGLLYQVARGEV